MAARTASPVQGVRGRLVLLLLLMAWSELPLASADERSDQMVIAMRPGDTELTRPPALEMKGTGGWLELNRFATSGRYRLIDGDDSQRDSVFQYQLSLKARLRLDRQGRVGLAAGIFTGDSFRGGWNRFARPESGREADIFLKHLYLDARLLNKLEVQYGGLEIAHGEATEVTSYDFDGYITGQRIRSAGWKALDEISVTYAHLGDLDDPSVFNRFRRLASPNYFQLLLDKKLAKPGGLSFEYTDVSGEQTLRQAVRFDLPARSGLDTVQLELYQRWSPEAGYGFGLYTQKSVHAAITLGVGYARIDRTGLNSDRFPMGRRLYATALMALHRVLGVSVFFSRQLDAAESSANRTRLDVGLSYDLRQIVAK